MTKKTVPVSISLVSVASARECLLGLQAGVALALTTLDQAFDNQTRLDGVADIFQALSILTCATHTTGVVTTVVFDGASYVRD